LEPIRRALAAFLRWWGDELWGLLPEPLRRLVSGPGPRIVVAVHHAARRVLEERGRQLRPIAPSSGPAQPRGQETNALADLAKSTRRVPIGIRLPFDACFSRRVALPAAARNDFRKLLSVDLQRATPFRAGDVYTSHYVEDSTGERGKLKVRQLVVKRTTLDPVIAEIESLGLRVSFADCWDEDGSTALPVNFLEAVPNCTTSFGSPLQAVGPLFGLALLLACSAVWLVVQKHENALDQLHKEIARAKGDARNVQLLRDRAEAALAEVASLRRIKLESIPVVQTLEDLSRLLPDSTWLTDLRIESDTVEFSGRAKSAANLLPLLERSAQFVDATLAAPLTFDPRDDKERFSVRVRLRRQTPVGATSRDGKSG
jgi:general secretion pathway protein L